MFLLFLHLTENSVLFEIAPFFLPEQARILYCLGRVNAHILVGFGGVGMGLAAGDLDL